MTALLIAMFAVLGLLFAPAQGSAQSSHVDTFDGPSLGPLWNSSTPYQLSLDNGALRVAMNKNDRWQGFYHSLGGAFDFSTNPVVNLKVRGDVPFVLHVYLVDTNDRNILLAKRIHEVGRLHEVCYDMATAPNVSNLNLKAIKAMIFTPNGNGKALQGTAWLDDLRVGNAATRFANARAVPDQHRFAGTTNSFLVTDIENASSLSVSTSFLLAAVSMGPVTNGQAWLTYNCQPGATGTETLSLTAHGQGRFADATWPFTVTVRGNQPPTLSTLPDQEVEAGFQQSIRLTGLSDGDASAEQTLTITATTDRPDLVPNSALTVTHATGSPYADLKIHVPALTTNFLVAVTADDGQVTDHATSIEFRVNTFLHFNHPPLLAPLPGQTIKLSSGPAALQMTGISDGDGGTQQLTFTATSDSQAVLPDTNIDVEYDGGATGQLRVAPQAAGSATVTLRVVDDGTGCENGPKELVHSFLLTVLPDLPAGYAEDFPDLSGWAFSATYAPVLSSFGGTSSLEMTANNKWYWDGYQLFFDPPLDLSEHPHISMEVYSEAEDTLHWLWFYDDTGTRNDNVGAMDKARWAPAGQWTSLTFDFGGLGEMSSRQGQPIRSGKIAYVLFNMHNQTPSWPLPANYSGRFYLRNVRVGSAADLGPPRCTLSGIPDQAAWAGGPPQSVVLQGISSGGAGGPATVTAASDNTNRVPHPTVSAIAPDGTATLTYSPKPTVGRANVSVTVQADGALPTNRTFSIDLLASDSNSVVTVTADAGQQRQTIRGFGAFQFPDRPQHVDTYTEVLGASAVRLGLIGNVLEPRNDNNDPNVLDRAALDYSAFDFDYLRTLKAQGVETFILSSWTPPAWMKDNLSLDYAFATTATWEGTDNRLSTYWYEEFAESIVAVVRVLKEEADIDLHAIGLQNEPAFCEPYGSAILDPARFVKLIKTVGQRFASEGIATRLYMPEQVFSQDFYSMKQYIDALHADPVADALCQVIATHGYAADGIQPGQPDYSQWNALWTNSAASPVPKELWMTEAYPSSGDWSNALSLAGAIHGALTAGNVGLWTLWDIEGSLLASGNPTPNFGAARHYYANVRPGWRRISTSTTHADVLASAFRDSKSMTLVVINKGEASLAVRMAGPIIPATFDVRLSSRDRSYESMPAITNGMLLLPPRSIATLTGSIAYELWSSGVNWDDRDSSPAADADQDGQDNYREFTAGTDPMNPTSVFRANGVHDLGNVTTPEIVIRWLSVSNRWYSVHRSPDLYAPFAELAADLPATPPENAYTDRTFAAQAEAFYAITTHRQNP